MVLFFKKKNLSFRHFSVGFCNISKPVNDNGLADLDQMVLMFGIVQDRIQNSSSSENLDSLVIDEYCQKITYLMTSLPSSG